MPVEFKEDSIKEWVTNNLEEGQVAEVVLHGCSGGVVGELIYYADTSAFYEKYKEAGMINPNAKYGHHGADAHLSRATDLFNYIKQKNI